jgi:hypothetical protein
MTDKVDNGKRVSIKTPDFDGEAGLVGNQLAYRPTDKTKRIRAGSKLTVDDKERTVLAAEKSQYVPGMVVLTLEAL